MTKAISSSQQLKLICPNDISFSHKDIFFSIGKVSGDSFPLKTKHTPHNKQTKAHTQKKQTTQPLRKTLELY